ncbi:helix-turn-helix transcriptional regulator [Alkalicaulis satelles]|uniref:Helix-turn-helix transcriptional regulator n=2 Tax=Alkalicaulis satelles TaxID=2609175 RepID=A0A5M6ZCL1_9PROT|nr:helix-turn-helix transcriptional regulator [Alkalicaulis satelles]
MGRDFTEVLAQMPADRRARIEAEAERLYGEHVTLSALRKARALTQAQLAERLGKSQVSIARLEKRSDLLLSTLRSYVEAMGGTLTLSAHFPDGEPVLLDTLLDTHEAETA